MSTAITLAGENLIAAKFAAGEVLAIDRIILADVPGLDPAQEVDRAEGMPDAGSIVHDYVIPEEFKGYVNPNQVVYSMLLGSDIGPFSFNWLGLYSSAEDTVIAVTHLPRTQKWQTEGTHLGNNLTRNFMLEFSGAQALTQITVEAATWQVDFTVRLHGIDERERRSNRDVYGRSCFWGDGLKAVKNGAAYGLQPGIAYVEGVRIEQETALGISPGALPTSVWLDVSLQGQGSDVTAAVAPVFGGSREDYTDANLTRHFLVKIADISAAGVVTDLRRTEPIGDDVLQFLRGHAKRTDNPHGVSCGQIGAAEAGHNHDDRYLGRTEQAADSAKLEGRTKAQVISEARNWGASETVRGPMEIATQNEVNAGTDHARAVTPKTLEGRIQNLYGGAALLHTANTVGTYNVSVTMWDILILTAAAKVSNKNCTVYYTPTGPVDASGQTCEVSSDQYNTPTEFLLATGSGTVSIEVTSLTANAKELKIYKIQRG